ncbi:MAG: hypothetical protein ACRD82_07230 [Blastocatellia bacterium]
MKVWFSKKRLSLLTAMVVGMLTALAQGQEVVPTAKPDATINLAYDDGAKLVKGQWRYSDTKIVEIDFKSPGADNSRPALRTKLTITRRRPARRISTIPTGKRFRLRRLKRGARPGGSASTGIASRSPSPNALEISIRPVRRLFFKPRWMITPKSGLMAN